MWKKPDTTGYIMYFYLFIFYKKQNYKDRKQISGCQDRGIREEFDYK